MARVKLTSEQVQRAAWEARLRSYTPGGFWLKRWGQRPEHGNRAIPADLWPRVVRQPYKDGGE